MIIDLKLDIDTLEIDDELKEQLRYQLKDTITKMVFKEIATDPTILKYVAEIKQNLIGGLTSEKQNDLGS